MHLFSLHRQYKISLLNDFNFTPIAIIGGCTARFVSDLVGNLCERFSRDAAQIIIKPFNVLLILKIFYYSIVSSHRAVIAAYKVARAKMRTN